jgi:hypothetical protein
VRAPKFLPPLGQVSLAKQSRGLEFERVNQPGNRKFWRIANEQVNMVVLTIKLTQFCPHLGADVRVGRPEVFLDPVRYP